MIDREKVTAAIDGCLQTEEFQCEECPYLGKQADVLGCFGALMKDASELLKSDQYYLQKLTERLQDIADIAIRGLPEVKDD